MKAMIELNAFFQADRIYDVAISDPWVVVAPGENRLALYNFTDNEPARLLTNIPMDASILVTPTAVFSGNCKANTKGVTDHLDFAPFGEIDLKDTILPHQAAATKKKIYMIHHQGDLFRADVETGQVEIPKSPYGVYERQNLKVFGIGVTPKGVAALSRHQARAETLVDSLPDDPSRPIARAGVLKDGEYGARLSGPAVAARRAFILCHEKGFLLSMHLHKPELMERTPVPGALCKEKEVILAADPDAGIWAACAKGIYGLNEEPALIPFPDGKEHGPSRMIAHKNFILLHTQEGKLFGLERV